MATRKPSGLDTWKARKIGTAVLPSGQQIKLRRLTLDELAADDALSEELLTAVVLELQPGGTVAEMARLQDPDKVRKVSQDSLRVRDQLVVRAVIDPVVTVEDLADVDPFDKALIADLASGQSDLDATGRRVWGVEPLNTFQVFRDEHGCPEDLGACDACERVSERFSAMA